MINTAEHVNSVYHNHQFNIRCHRYCTRTNTATHPSMYTHKHTRVHVLESIAHPAVPRHNTTSSVRLPPCLPGNCRLYYCTNTSIHVRDENKYSFPNTLQHLTRGVMVQRKPSHSELLLCLNKISTSVK